MGFDELQKGGALAHTGMAQPSPSVVRSGPFPVLGQVGCETDPREEETEQRLAKYPWLSPQQSGGYEGD